MKNQAYNEFNDQPERFIPVNVDNRCYSNIVGARLTERGTRSVEAAGGEVTFYVVIFAVAVRFLQTCQLADSTITLSTIRLGLAKNSEKADIWP